MIEDIFVFIDTHLHLIVAVNKLRGEMEHHKGHIIGGEDQRWNGSDTIATEEKKLMDNMSNIQNYKIYRSLDKDILLFHES